MDCQGETYRGNFYGDGVARFPEKPPRLDEPHERLQWARERAGCAEATEAARRYGWNENTYRSHENGNRPLSRGAAERYARKLKVPAGWLLYGEGAMTPPVDPETAVLWQNITDEQREMLRSLMRDLARKRA